MRPGETTGPGSGRFHVLSPAGAAALAVVVYARAIGNGFVWDDPIVLEQLSAFRSAADFFFQPDVVPKFYYRPLTFLSLAADRAIGGEHPWLFHFTNVILHAFNTVLVGHFLIALGGIAPSTAMAATFLFAVHPVHAEAVAWISGRADLLVCLFCLLAALLASNRPTLARDLGVALLYLAGLLAKETAVALLPIFPLLDRLLGHRWRWRRDLLVGLATALYLFLRTANVGTVLGGSDQHLAFAVAALQILRAISVYVVHAAVPGLVNIYMPTVPASPAYAATGIALLAFTATAWVRLQQDRRRLLLFFLTWFFAFLLPVTLVLLRKSAVTLVADRYLYLPSVASCALLAWLVLEGKFFRQSLVKAVWLALLVASAGKTIAYSTSWRNGVTFWRAAQAAAPGDPLATRELGLALLEQGDIASAKQWLQSALKLARTPEDRAMAASNLASAHRRAGDLQSALALLRGAVAEAPHPALFHNLGLTEMTAAEHAQRSGRTTEVVTHVLAARQAFERALSFLDSPVAGQYRPLWDPAKTHSLLGQVYWSLGEKDRAKEHLRAALRMAPTGPVAAATRQYWRQVLPHEPSP